MKKTLAFILSLALCALTLCCGLALAEGDAPTVDAIKAEGKIIMLTNAAFPPFEYLSDENEIVGVDVDIAREIAADLGVELEVVDMDFDGIIAAVQAGKGDFGAAGMTVRPDREEMINFTVKYVKSSQYILVAQGSDIASAEDLKGKVIGVQQGTSGDFYATDEVEGATIMRYKDALTASMDLAAGRIDAVITDELPAKSIVAANDQLVLIDEVLTEEEYAICVAKEKTDLLAAIDATLTRLMEEGKVDEYINNHMGLAAPEEGGEAEGEEVEAAE